MDKKKVKEAKEKSSYNRALRAVVESIEAGVDPYDVTLLFQAVEDEYKTGRHRSPSYIKKQFKRAYQYVVTELLDEGYENK